MELLNGKAVPVWPSEGDEVADISICQRRGYPARLAEGTFDVILSGFRARDTEGALSLAVNAVEPKHTGAICLFENFMVRRVLKLEFHGPYAWRFVVAGHNFHDGRLVDVLLRVVGVFCHSDNVDISCKVSVIPMSTGHWREQRPHPLQLFTLNLPGK